MKIQQFDKQNLRTLRDEINAALQQLGVKYGIVLHAGNCSFEAQSCKFQLQITTIGEGGSVETKEARDFKVYATMFGLKPEHLGAVVKLHGREFEITGIKPRSSKNPIVAKDKANGQSYKLPLEPVKQVLNL